MIGHAGLVRAIPVLPAVDIAAVVAFYQWKLGFSRTFGGSEYAGVARDGVEIHFWKCDDPALPKSSSCRIEVEGIETLYEECRHAGVVHPNGALADKPWGFREFVAVDLYGNAIHFAEPEKAA